MRFKFIYPSRPENRRENNINCWIKHHTQVFGASRAKVGGSQVVITTWPIIHNACKRKLFYNRLRTGPVLGLLIPTHLDHLPNFVRQEACVGWTRWPRAFNHFLHDHNVADVMERTMSRINLHRLMINAFHVTVFEMPTPLTS